MAQEVPSTGFWSAMVLCGEELKIRPGADLRITNVSVGDMVFKTHRRNLLLLGFTPAGTKAATNVLVGALISGMIDNMTCDILLEAGETYSFEAIGGNSFQLFGLFIEEEDDGDEEEVEEPEPTRMERQQRLRKLVEKPEKQADGKIPQASASVGKARRTRSAPDDDEEDPSYGTKPTVRKRPKSRPATGGKASR